MYFFEYCNCLLSKMLLYTIVIVPVLVKMSGTLAEPTAVSLPAVERQRYALTPCVCAQKSVEAL